MTLKQSQSDTTPVVQWEAHACLPLIPGQDMSCLTRYRDAGFHHVSINVGMDMTPFITVMRMIAGFRQWLAFHSEDFVLVTTTDDIYQARSHGKLAVSFDLEGSNMLHQDLAMVELFATLGVRQMLLAYNRDNSCSGGCHGKGTGLTPLGREVVGAMNAAGIIVDSSHASKRSSLEIMEISQRPVIFSHTNVKAIFDHPRTIDDEQIFACAGQGGVIGLTGLGIFMGDPSASVAAYVRQIDYLAERIGTSHIGLGLDTELYPEHKDLPEGESEDDWWPHEHYEQMNGHKQLQPEMLGEVAQQLTRLGYAPSEINAIYGENFMRIAKCTWPRSLN
ncbi:membrane dipeptidase [Pseudomonas sp. ES3-33]|uniref:membrane dipeptidase n=1 Tax=Pseudomonas sp. ES3-33 TaxID=1628833 RepID=UPI0005D4228B|nr:membrane dipeptidase [Pseudomonas sp. ES3-33]KJH77460.1 membrane dipeptidase (M19 family) [Pseudomonas sp. ES3-33]